MGSGNETTTEVPKSIALVGVKSGCPHLKSMTVWTSSRRSLQRSITPFRDEKTGEFRGGHGHSSWRVWLGVGPPVEHQVEAGCWCEACDGWRG